MGGRDEAIGRLVARSLTKPVNVLAGAAVVAAGILAGIWPLVAAGVVVYGVMAATTFFSVDEARAALRAPEPAPRSDAVAEAMSRVTDPGILGLYTDAQAEYQGILRAVAASPVPLPEVEVETAGLVEDLAGLCRRAQSVTDYLSTVDERRLRAERERAASELAQAPPELVPALTETVGALDQQIATVEEMRGRLRAFDARMRHLTSSLGAIRGEIATLAVESEHDSSERIAERVHGARELVTGLNEAMAEAEGRRRAAGGGGT